jgi:hypothetical protein
MKPEDRTDGHEAGFVREDAIRPDPTPAWRQALGRYEDTVAEYLAQPRDDKLRLIFTLQDRLTARAFLAGTFPLGRVLMTPGAGAALDAQFHCPGEFLLRHRNGDWGELDAHDVAENERSLRNGFRLLSSYPLRREGRLWVITEADRSATTLLLPDEY